uniref:signaling threshold-regulating transmembrane adapter 1-like n=1 Tax=Semicossyphus pulcher TaxID=241346 RepID=UPI0037E71EA3
MADGCNVTLKDWKFLCTPFHRHLLIGVIGTILLLSICLNIFFCVSKCCSGTGMCQPRTRRRRGPRQMEENPIYGNLGYMQTSMTLFTDADPLQGVNSVSQFKSQDCYANLTLKPPRLQSGRSSPQIQYSDVVLLEEPQQSEKEEEEGSVTEAVSNMSDLYASVQTQRTKTVQPAIDGEEYANHL